MKKDHKNILPLLDSIEINKYYVICYFKCKVKNKVIVSTVPFEPYEGKIEISWQDILLHPFKSYNKYYHTPITIYNKSSENTIALKAFEKISKYFVWDLKEEKYIYSGKN